MQWHYLVLYSIWGGNAAGIQNNISTFLYIDKMVNALYLEPILDPLSQEYTEVLTVDALPEGPLRDFVKQKRLPEVSTFKKTTTYQCKYVLVHPDNEYMKKNDIPFLFSYFQKNGYTLEYQQTKLFKQPYLVCMVSYTGVAPP